jgi:hypothetical protein
MTQLYANNASAFLASAVAGGDTTLPLVSAAAFPTLSAPGDFYLLTLVEKDDAGEEAAWEIVKATAAEGNLLTVTRAQEGTAARDWAQGTLAELRLTAGGLARKLDAAQATSALLTGVAVTPENDTQSLALATLDLTTGVAGVDSVTLPLASDDAPGLMPAPSFAALAQAITDISALKGGNRRRPTYTPLPEELTQEAVQAAWEDAGGAATPTDGDTLLSFADPENIVAWSYFTSDSLWHYRGQDTATAATNTTMGLIRGSENDGQVFMESDATGSVVGWDNAVKKNAAAQLTAGFTAASHDAGTVISGSLSLDPALGNFWHYNNGGAHTLVAPAMPCTMLVEVVNIADSVISPLGFTKVSGDDFAPASGAAHLAHVRVTAHYSVLNWEALQ